MELAKAWVAYEWIDFGIYNFNLNGSSPEEAKALVADGKKRWAYCRGGVLTLVDIDYQLLSWESFVEAKDGRLVCLG